MLKNLEERGNMGAFGVDGGIILKRILKKLDIWMWIGFKWFMIRFSGEK
jgi:hypothetical protein